MLKRLKKNIPVKLFMIFFSLSFLNHAQTKSNLELFYSMIDSSAASIVKDLPAKSKNINVEIYTSPEYTVLTNKLLGYLANRGINISGKSDSNQVYIKYVIDKTEVDYPNVFREGLFGNYYTVRKLILTGNFILGGSKTIYNNFSYSYEDSVKTDSVGYIENSAFPFTKGEISSEPFFSSLFEPAVAIGAAAVAVILFFTVRNK